MAFSESRIVDILSQIFAWLTIVLTGFVYFLYVKFENTRKNKCKNILTTTELFKVMKFALSYCIIERLVLNFFLCL